MKCKRDLLALLSCYYELLFLLCLAWGFLWIIIKPALTLPPLKFLYFTIGLTYTDFLTFIHYPNFSIITNHCINYNQQNVDFCLETWSLDLVSIKSFHLGLAKNLYSRSEPLRRWICLRQQRQRQRRQRITDTFRSEMPLVQVIELKE